MTEHNPHLRRTLVTLLLGCALVAASTASASAAVLKADYGFSGNLTSSVLPAPDLVQVGNCLTPNDFATETVNLVADPVLVFNAGCGLQLDTSTLVAPGSWSLALLFRFSDVTAFRRVFDATPGLTDHGLYVHNGALDFNIGFNQEGPTQPIATDQYAQVVLTRDAATQELDGYVNGELQFSVSDALGDALLTPAQTPRLLIDDAGEDSAGAVSRVRVYDAPLTAAEVAALDGNPPTDVSITTTSDSNPSYVGAPLGYTLAVSDSGPDASGVVVSDTLPAGVDFVSASPGCTELNRVVTCGVGAVSRTAPVTLHIVVRPTAVNPALANTATVTSTPPDPNPANDSSTATTDVRPPADLAVTMARDVADAVVGQTFGYTVGVTNHGPGAAHAVVLTDALSADVDLVSTSAGCILSAGTLTCDLGDLASGASATRRIVVRATAPNPQLLNTATVESLTGDLNLVNNSATTFTNVHPPLGLPVVAAVPTATPPGPSAPVAPPVAVVAPTAQAGTNPLGKPVVAATTRRALLRSGLRFSQRFGGAGSVRWTLTLPASRSSKALVLGTATRTLSGAGTVRITLKLSSAGRRRLAGKHPTKLALRTSFKPAGQSQHTIATVVVRLRG